MANPTIEQVKMQVESLGPQIREAEDYIRFLKAAGENTSQMDQKINALKIRYNNYKQALASQGIVVEDV